MSRTASSSSAYVQDGIQQDKSEEGRRSRQSTQRSQSVSPSTSCRGRDELAQGQNGQVDEMSFREQRKDVKGATAELARRLFDDKDIERAWQERRRRRRGDQGSVTCERARLLARVRMLDASGRDPDRTLAAARVSGCWEGGGTHRARSRSSHPFRQRGRPDRPAPPA